MNLENTNIPPEDMPNEIINIPELTGIPIPNENKEPNLVKDTDNIIIKNFIKRLEALENEVEKLRKYVNNQEYLKVQENNKKIMSKFEQV